MEDEGGGHCVDVGSSWGTTVNKKLISGKLLMKVPAWGRREEIGSVSPEEGEGGKVIIMLRVTARL